MKSPPRSHPGPPRTSKKTRRDRALKHCRSPSLFLDPQVRYRHLNPKWVTNYVNWAPTKAAVIHVTRSIAVELARYNIRVNCIAPAHIPTAINANLDQSLIVRAMQPLQRVGSPRDVGEAAAFLASDRAAQITGVVLPIDGGTTAGPPPRSVKSLLADRDQRS